MGCAGYLEAQCRSSQDSVGVWHPSILARAFFKDEQGAWKQLSADVMFGQDKIPYVEDTLLYRDGRTAYRDWYSKYSLKDWDSLQRWSVSDSDLGIFSDSISSPADITISNPRELLKNDSVLNRNGFTISYTNPRCDSVWVTLLTGVFPQKGQPFEIYVNDMSVRSFYNKKVPATGSFTVIPEMLKSLPMNAMIGVEIVAQTAILSKHFEKWYIFRSTSMASIDRPQ